MQIHLIHLDGKAVYMVWAGNHIKRFASHAAAVRFVERTQAQA